MDYPITIGTKREILIDAYRTLTEIAGRLASQDGTPLYDSIIPHSGDCERMCNMVDEAVSIFCTRMMSRYNGTHIELQTASGVTTKTYRIILDIPDYPYTTISETQIDLRKYLASYVVAELVRERYQPLAEQYGQICQSALGKAVADLLNRKPIIRTC